MSYFLIVRNIEKISEPAYTFLQEDPASIYNGEIIQDVELLDVGNRFDGKGPTHLGRSRKNPKYFKSYWTLEDCQKDEEFEPITSQYWVGAFWQDSPYWN